MKTPDSSLDPEKLLQALDAQMALSRSKRDVQHGNRNTFRILSLAVLIGGTILAFALLEYMVSNLPQPRHSEEPAAANAEK